MPGLDVIGVAGSEDVKEMLVTCSNPDEAIEKFREENSILLPSISPALSLLDLQGVSRLAFHENVVEMLREALLKQVSTTVASMPDEQKQKKLSELLTKSFPLVRVPDLEVVTMEILKHIPSIKEEYLEEIERKAPLYRAAPVEAKRQIWVRNHTLFGKELYPLVTEYMNAKLASLLCLSGLTGSSAQGPGAASSANTTGTTTALTPGGPALAGLTTAPFFSVSPRLRRQSAEVRAVANMVGGSLVLYRLTLQMLSRLLMRTRDVFYCSLRGDLLMSLHEGEVNEICLSDPTHKVTWCIDACTREGEVDTKRAAELQNFMDGIKKEQLRGEEGAGLISDLAMVLCDPYAVHTFAKAGARLVDHCLASEMLPRECPDLLLMVRLLVVATNALTIIDHKSPKDVDMDSGIMTSFLTNLVMCMAEAKVTESGSKAKVSESGLKDIFSSADMSNPATTLLALHCACQVPAPSAPSAVAGAGAGQQSGGAGGTTPGPALCAFLCALPHWSLPKHYEGTCLHILVSAMADCATELISRDIFFPAVQHLFLNHTAEDWRAGHLLRLLTQTHTRLAPDHLSAITGALAAAPKDEKLSAAYTSFMERLPK